MTKSIVTWNHPSDMVEVGGSSVVTVKVYKHCVICVVHDEVDI